VRAVEPVVDMNAFVNPFAVRRSVASTTSAMTARRPAAGPPTLQPSPGHGGRSGKGVTVVMRLEHF